MKKNKFPISLVLGLVIAILVIFIVLQNIGQINVLGGKSLSSEEISSKVVDVISKDIGAKPDDIVIESIEKEGHLYKLNLKILGQTYTSYATIDGKYLFPQKIDLVPTEAPKPKDKQEISKTDKPEVDLFVMSYCPFGNQAEELMSPIVGLLGDKANINLHYVIYGNYLSGYPDYCIDKENKYCSMHGIQEIHQDMRELCVQKYDKEKLWNFVIAMNKDTSSDNADKKWEGIARQIGIDTTKISQCQKDEGLTLLDNELKLTSIAYPVQDPSQYNGQTEAKISGSPTLLINGVIYGGERSTKGYQTTICDAFNKMPDNCLNTLDEGPAATNESCE